MDVALPPTPSVSTNTDVLVPLSGLRRGEAGVIVMVDAPGADAVRLKTMGLCEGRSVCLLGHGDPCIVGLMGVRIGLSARLARHVGVRPCPAGTSPRGDA